MDILSYQFIFCHFSVTYKLEIIVIYKSKTVLDAKTIQNELRTIKRMNNHKVIFLFV